MVRVRLRADLSDESWRKTWHGGPGRYRHQTSRLSGSRWRRGFHELFQHPEINIFTISESLSGGAADGGILIVLGGLRDKRYSPGIVEPADKHHKIRPE